MIDSAPEVEELAASVEDNGGAYFVPAFSGLFAPYWQSDARGALVGLTRFVNRVTSPARPWRPRPTRPARFWTPWNADSGVTLAELKVDGGMTANETLMQFQADQAGRAGGASGGRRDHGAGRGLRSRPRGRLLERPEQDVIDNWAEDKRWEPVAAEEERARLYRNWKKAVTKTFDWVDEDVH